MIDPSHAFCLVLCCHFFTASRVKLFSKIKYLSIRSRDEVFSHWTLIIKITLWFLAHKLLVPAASALFTAF